MTRYITCIIIIVIMLFVVSSEANAWIIRGYKPGLLETRWGRQQEAREQLASFKKLNSQLPTLSPDEMKWVQTEYYDQIKSARGHFTKRALAAMNSKEYLLHKAKPQVETIVGILTELSNPEVSLKREVYLWANLSSLYLNVEFWGNFPALADIYGLIEKDLLTEKGYDWNKSPESIYRELEINASSYSEHILNVIVVPYLSENMKK